MHHWDANTQNTRAVRVSGVICLGWHPGQWLLLTRCFKGHNKISLEKNSSRQQQFSHSYIKSSQTKHKKKNSLTSIPTRYVFWMSTKVLWILLLLSVIHIWYDINYEIKLNKITELSLQLAVILRKQVMVSKFQAKESEVLTEVFLLLSLLFLLQLLKHVYVLNVLKFKIFSISTLQ